MDTQQLAITALLEGELACAIAHEGQVVFTSAHRGVRPLVEFYHQHGTAHAGAALADKVVGRAAALLAHLVGITSVYGQVMSRPALEALEQRGITAGYGQLVEGIRNRDNTGPCPMEALSQGVEDPEVLLEKVEAFFQSMPKP